MEHPNYQEFPKRGDTLKKQINNLNLPKHLEIDDDNPNGPTPLRVDFEELRMRKKELETHQDLIGLNRSEVDGALDNLEYDGKMNEFYHDVLTRILEETNFLRDFDQAQLLYQLLAGIDRGNIAAYSEVRWGVGKEILTQNKGGDFHPFTRVSRIAEEPPTKKEILYSLARSGYFPESIYTLLHETAHSFQWDTKELLKTICLDVWNVIQGKSMDLKKELKEAQGYRVSQPTDYRSKINLINFIPNIKNQKGDPLYPNVVVDKLIYSITAIDQLSALGFSIDEIAKIIRKSGKWDEESATYPGIERIIAEKARTLFQYHNDPAYEPEPHDYEPDLENLVHVDKLERKIDRLRAKQIVEEELAKELEKQGPFPEIEALMKQSNIPRKMFFSPSFRRHELRKALHDLTSEALPAYPEERILTPEEEKILANIFKISKEKLLELEVSHAEKSFPTRNQIKFEEHFENLGPAVFSTEKGNVIVVSVPRGADFQDPSIQKTVYQGIAGFITSRLVEPSVTPRSGQSYLIVLEGFDQINPELEPPVRKGMFTVPLSELFALYCIQDELEPTVTTEFSIQMPAMIALIEALAEKKNISFLEAFSQLFKSNTCLLGNMLDELRENFGKQAVEKINEVQSLYGMGVVGKEKVIEMAKYCGFYERYELLQREIDQGNPIGLEGIRAKVIKSIPGRDHDSTL